MDEKRDLETNNNAGIETEQKKLGESGPKWCQQTVFAYHFYYVSLDVFVYEV